MITVTLGTIPFPFNRAIDWIAVFLEREVITESIFVQYGTTDISKITHHPLVTTASKVPFPDFIKLVENSRLIISHAGQGSTRELASRDANFVLLPRLARYREHIDDHQLMFAESIASKGIRYCLTLQELEKLIQYPSVSSSINLFNGPQLSDHLIKRYPPTSEAPPKGKTICS